jgi:hypothetical protein
MAALSEFEWVDVPLHGDVWSGNLAITSDGPLWLDFEAACSGPLEWDLVGLPQCSPAMPHNPDLLSLLRRLRQASVVPFAHPLHRSRPRSGHLRSRLNWPASFHSAHCLWRPRTQGRQAHLVARRLRDRPAVDTALNAALDSLTSPAVTFASRPRFFFGDSFPDVE